MFRCCWRAPACAAWGWTRCRCQDAAGMRGTPDSARAKRAQSAPSSVDVAVAARVGWQRAPAPFQGGRDGATTPAPFWSVALGSRGEGVANGPAHRVPLSSDLCTAPRMHHRPPGERSRKAAPCARATHIGRSATTTLPTRLLAGPRRLRVRWYPIELRHASPGWTSRMCARCSSRRSLS